MRIYDSYIDSGIEVLGKVPSSWKKSKFKFQHFEQDERVGEDSTEYDLLSLTKKGIILRDIESGKGKFPESFDTYKKVKKDDLIFCLYDIEETPRTVGLSKLNGMITGSYKIFNSKDVITKFTYYTFLVIDDVKGLKPYYTGLRNVVRPETFKSLPFFIPPLSEQQQIVSFLDTKTSLIDSLIEKTQRKIELLKEKKTSLINEVVTKGLNPNVEMKDSGVEWIGEIPGEWKIVPLRYLGSFQNGISKGSEFFGTGYPFMSYGDVYNNDVTPTELKGKVQLEDKELNRYSILRGDVFFTRTSETKDDIGVCSTCLTSIQNSGFSGFVIRLRFHNNVHIPEYSKYHFQTHWKKVIIESKMNIVTRSSLSQQVLGDTPVLIPDIDEQQQIVEYLDEQTQLIDNTISIEVKRIELLKEYRQSLISEVVTGKRKVV